MGGKQLAVRLQNADLLLEKGRTEWILYVLLVIKISWNKTVSKGRWLVRNHLSWWTCKKEKNPFFMWWFSFVKCKANDSSNGFCHYNDVLIMSHTRFTMVSFNTHLSSSLDHDVIWMSIRNTKNICSNTVPCTWHRELINCFVQRHLWLVIILQPGCITEKSYLFSINEPHRARSLKHVLRKKENVNNLWISQRASIYTGLPKRMLGL